MCPTLVEIRSVTSEISRGKKAEKKKERKTTAVKYEAFGIAVPVPANYYITLHNKPFASRTTMCCVCITFQPGAPPSTDAFRSKSSAPTNFRKFYERGDFPVALEHDTKGNKIAWKVIIDMIINS